MPEVIDAWYDSGAMPFAQWGYPHRNAELFEQRYPAQFICEAIDQTRGWFYTLMAVGTLVFDRSSYENVVCLGHILAEDGRKMSKHLGNILEPIPLMDQHGADAVRWFMAAVGSPWSARRVGHDHAAGGRPQDAADLLEHGRRSRRCTGAPPAGRRRTPTRRRPTGRCWTAGCSSELHRLVREVDAALADFDTPRGRQAARARSSTTCPTGTCAAAAAGSGAATRRRCATLHEALSTVTLLMAPITPFITERVWQDLVVPVTPTRRASVHLAACPAVDEALIDPALSAQMAARPPPGRAGPGRPRRLRHEDAPAAGPGAGLGAAASPSSTAELLAEIADELNVGVGDCIGRAGGCSLVDTTAKANFRALGKRFGKAVQQVAAAIAAADAAALASSAAARPARRRSPWTARPVALGPDEVIVTETPREGWAVAVRRRRDARARPAPHAGAAPGRAGPRGDPADPGGPQDQRPGGLRPDRAAVRGDRRARRPRPSREHGDLVADEVLATDYAPGRPDWAGRRAVRRRGPGPDLLAPEGLMPRSLA